MADTRTPEQRSRIMAAVRSRNTTPEVALRKALYAAGVRGWRCHYKAAPGRPDLAWPRRRVAVFVDGAFWHGHPWRYKPGRSAGDWDDKIARNIERDREDEAALADLGWKVLRLWDFDVKRDLGDAVQQVRALLDGVNIEASSRKRHRGGAVRQPVETARYRVGDEVLAKRQEMSAHERAIVCDVRVHLTPETRARRSERIEQVLVKFEDGTLRLLLADSPAVR
jgi:DNA mismatch endonuclease (patch repair protein)